MAVKQAYITATTTAQTVALTGKAQGYCVVNLDGAGIITFREDGTTAALADENFMVPAAVGAYKIVNSRGPHSVSVYATASTRVHIEQVDG